MNEKEDFLVSTNPSVHEGTPHEASGFVLPSDAIAPTINRMFSAQSAPAIEELGATQQPDLFSLYQSLRDDTASSITNLGPAGTNAFADPRTDPASDSFDHTMWLKAVRAYARANHMEFSEMPIAFRDLTVIGSAQEDTKIPTVGSTIFGFLQPVYQIARFFKRTNATLFPPKSIGEKIILNGFTGVMKPGELVLVIGRPGSGCSSFLRTLANQTRTFKEVKGEIKYSGFSSKDIENHYRGQIVYAQEDDPHIPSLTVRQTLEFALACKIENPLIRSKILEITLKVYGLVGCQNTVVGDSNLRGVSGGEKKRVSLAEATVVGGSAGIFDGCTKGLDAASSLDFIRALRSFADFQNRAVVASCYQASDAMFDLFDKVVVLADGECTYFGPTQEAVAYFQDLGFPKHPRDTAAEYLTTCASGSKISAPEFARIYRESVFGHGARREADHFLSPDVMQQDQKAFSETYRSRQTHFNSSHVKEGNPYSVPLSRQAQLLIKREAQIVKGSLASVVIKYFVNMVMAVIVGSVYFQIPVDASGAYTRGGVIFFALLFNSVSAVSEIPKILEGRTVLYKHIDMALYKPSTSFIAKFIFQFMLDCVQVMLFSIILYLMAGLQKSAAHFFTFYIALLLTQQAFGNLVRLFGFVSKDKATAQNLSGVILIANVIYSGYIIPNQYMKPWFVWIYWISPIAYGFKTLIINEFQGLVLACENTDMIPAGPLELPSGTFYTNPAYQTCSLAGALPGQRSVSGEAYLLAALNIDSSNNWMWWNFLINIGFFVLFFVVDCVVMDTLRHGGAGLSVKLFKPEESDEKRDKRIARLKKLQRKTVAPVVLEEGAAVVAGFEATEEELNILRTLIWKDVVYSVPHPKEKKQTLQLLTNVNGYAKPGTMTALMGSSGAGKTTLLDVIAMRKTTGKIDGNICIGKEPQGPSFKKMSGYCEQMDVHNQDATVRESLRFSALLRQPASVSVEDKFEYVEKVLDLLEMSPIADALIGNLESGIGLNMEERKRLTIGIELVAKPKILFLDEPTSGLDAQAASNIVKLLRTLTLEGYALVVTIHQPSAMLFSEFDRLLLLGRGGKTIYFGELGHDCETLLNYFEKTGAPKCEPRDNPAEYILESIGAGTGHTSNTIDWFSAWSASVECQTELDTVKELQEHAEVLTREHAAEIAKSDRKLLTDIPSTGSKIVMVMNRMFRSYWRNPTYNVGRISFQIAVALIIGLTFFQLTNTPGGAQNRIFAIYMTSVLGVVVINLVIPMLIDQRTLSMREQSSGTYGPIAFGLAITTVEIPFAIIASTVFYVLFYWTVGLNPSSEAAGYFYLMFIMYTLWAISFGQMIASAVPSQPVAAAIVPLMSSILSLLCGVTIPFDSMPKFYSSWLYWINPYHYFIEGLIVNDLHNTPIHCDGNSFVPVNIPTGETCGQYFTVYSKFAPGIVQDATAMGQCLWCPLQVGDTIFEKFSWSYENRWRNVGLMLVFWIFNRVCTAVFINRFKVKR
ncbi:hypothetical protein HDU98_000105 [Podochytrium sp. JEL0797]|nr:hypothetical protein HDU98_000105 [Podochytrium sp. JEL0797]